MLFALRLGPVESNTGPIRVYFGGTDDEMLVKPCVAASDAEGLRTLKERVKGGPFLCEEALALAGRAQGFEVAEPPLWLLKQRAALAVSMANRRSLDGVAPAAILELLGASVAFWRAEPWRHVDSDDTLHARLMSPPNATYEASILGSAGQEFGMALYEGKNALATIRRAKDEPAAAKKIHSLAITYDAHPEFVLDALDGAYEVGGVPVPMRIEAGKLKPLSTSDVLVIAAALRAAAQFTEGTVRGSGVVAFGEVTVRVDIAASADAFEAPPAIPGSRDKPKKERPRSPRGG
jgi:hypothetical protein